MPIVREELSSSRDKVFPEMRVINTGMSWFIESSENGEGGVWEEGNNSFDNEEV